MTDRDRTVIFFDLRDTLLRRTATGWETAPGAMDLLDAPQERRLGVLCNLSPGHTRRDVQRLLESAGLYDRFDPGLIVVASDLGIPLPDRRAFAVAAALAETPIDRCVFVSADVRLLLGAMAAGMPTLQIQAPVAPSVPAPASAAPVEPVAELLAAEAPAPAAPAAVPALLAGAADEDAGPTFVLRGRIVTLDGSRPKGGVIDHGWVAVRQGKIAALGGDGEAIPAPFAQAVTVDTAGTIYPGLMDLHNHLAYNVLPLWVVPKKYTNRGQWPRHPDYGPQVQLPINILGAYAPTARSIVRYIETKALIGGTTTGQGIRSKQASMTKLYRGAVRAVEQTDDPRLPEASSKVLDYKPGNAQDTASFKSALKNLQAYFYHLAEGIDDSAHSHFTDLVQNGLIRPSLVGIHSLGLTADDLKTLAGAGAKIVWSPFSNLLLYGQTLDLKALKQSGALFSLGCDWAPTGSKNLLEELKVARYVSQAQGGVLSSRDLVRAVTANPAQILGWQQYVGTLKPGAFADLVVVGGVDGDPYDHLIDATEAAVRLVTIQGVPRYGDADLMHRLHTDAAHAAEPLTVGGKKKALYSYSDSSPLNDLSLAKATELLQEAMADLPAFYQRTKDDAASLLAFGVDPAGGFALELDNEYDPAADTPTAAVANAELADPTAASLLAANPEDVAKTVELDGLEVRSGTYLQRVAQEKNIDPQLAQELTQAYG